MRAILVLAAVTLLSLEATVSHAQDFAGTWQGHAKVETDERIIFRIGKTDSANWTAQVVHGEDWAIAEQAEAVVITDDKIKISLDGAAYEGVLSPDGQTLRGALTVSGFAPQFTLNLSRATPATLWVEPPHKVQHVTVDTNVAIEVLDWGGTGRPLVLLSGLGNTAHVFDVFATLLARDYHVYGVTRRGFGTSSVPPDPPYDVTPAGENTYDLRPSKTAMNPYDANVLGDDVIKVLDALKLVRPVVIGHSIAGEELSSIATRHRDRVAGLVYLDAFYEYAYADGVEYETLTTADHPRRVSVPPGQPMPSGPAFAIRMGTHEYRAIPVPALAICATPLAAPLFGDTAEVAKFEAREKRMIERYDRIATALPSVKFVRLAQAAHYLFRSNEADVLREIKAFIGALPR